jgi:LacI family transcriptional regulator
LQIAREIEAQIAAGRWDGKRMPGVRALAEQFGVSIVTASRALQLLADRGLIDTVERSGCYVRANRPTTSDSFALCQRVTSGFWQQATEQVLRTGFEEAAREQQMALLAGQLTFRDDTPERELQRLVETVVAGGGQGVCFLPSRHSPLGAEQDGRFLQVCADVGLPVVLVERNLRGPARPLTHDLVACDDLDGGFQATRHLIEQGRHRIAFVQSSPTSSHESRLAGYLLALAQAGGGNGPRTPILLAQSLEQPSPEAYRTLTTQLIDHKADGVVCYHDYTAMGLILEMLSRGLQVPRDVGLIGFGDLPLGNSFTIGLTTFAAPATEIARQALRLMRDRLVRPNAAPIKVLVPGRLFPRESTDGATP